MVALERCYGAKLTYQPSHLGSTVALFDWTLEYNSNSMPRVIIYEINPKRDKHS
jgi:hypothetical protein